MTTRKIIYIALALVILGAVVAWFISRRKAKAEEKEASLAGAGSSGPSSSSAVPVAAPPVVTAANPAARAPGRAVTIASTADTSPRKGRRSSLNDDSQ